LADIAALVIVLALGSGLLLFDRARRDREATIHRVAADARRLELELKYRAASKSVELNPRGWPVTVDPKWFDADPPVNALLSPHRPWVEVASPDEAGLLHPHVRMAVDESYAAFWYNPYQGVVRARVPVMVNDDQATEIYNRVNATAISSIFFEERPQLLPEIPGAKPALVPSVLPPDQTSEPPPGSTANAAEKRTDAQSTSEPPPTSPRPRPQPSHTGSPRPIRTHRARAITGK
jgi:hypothetical protein